MSSERSHRSIGEVLSRDLRRIGGYIFAALPIRASDTGDYLVRNLVGIDPDRGLVAIGDLVEPGTEIQFARRDAQTARDDLERRVHDLKLTRQVTMQSLPSIRLVQENDKSLVTKINSTLVNTVPLWETQLAQAVTIQRSAEAAEAVREANDLTNELLTANAENLRSANKMISEEMERGVFEIEAVKKANADPKSRAKAIAAFCFYCYGGTEEEMPDPGWKDMIRTCTEPSCPLYRHRPYKI